MFGNMKKTFILSLIIAAAAVISACDKISPAGILMAGTAVEDRVKMSYKFYKDNMDNYTVLITDNKDYSFIVGADSHLTTDPGRLDEMMAIGLEHNDLFYAHLGDLADTKAEYYYTLDSLLKKAKERYVPKYYNKINDFEYVSKDDPSGMVKFTYEEIPFPFYPVVGNHDITHSGWALWANIFHTSFYSIYVIVSEEQDKRIVDNFIFLDTANATLGREQVSLIEQDVLTPDEQAEIGLQVRHTFVFSHTSIFHVSSTELTSSFAREETYFLLNQFKKWNVNIAFFGHVHEWDERRNGNTQFLTLETMCEKNNPDPGDYLVRVHVKKDGTLSWERVHMNYTKP